jgi:hypothetical protein
MRHEVRSIPPAPRRIRWRPLFAHRWLLLATGGVLAVAGCLVAWLMFLQSGGKMSEGPRLDRGPVLRVAGTLYQVEPPGTWEGRAWQQVRYHFQMPVAAHTSNRSGLCFVPAGAWQPGDPVEVDVLVDDPNVTRIPGGVVHLDRQWLRARFWITVLAVPGAMVLLGWLAGMFQLRRVLVHGDVSIGVVHRVRRVPHVLPEMLRVDYTFRDHRAVTRHHHHWVRAHGELGARLLQQMQQNRYEEMPVLHDRRLPQWNRMLLPQDFLPADAAPRPDLPADTIP